MKLLSIMAMCVAIFALAFTLYVANGYKLSQCDFESDYKCEVIHGIGVVIPPAAFITVWFESDS